MLNGIKHAPKNIVDNTLLFSYYECMARSRASQSKKTKKDPNGLWFNIDGEYHFTNMFFMAVLIIIVGAVLFVARLKFGAGY